MLESPDPFGAVQEIHWQIHQATCHHQQVSKDRGHIAAEIGEVIRTFADELLAAGWPEHEARNLDVHKLTGSGWKM